MHTEDGEPDGIAEGQTSNASQQSKHFQLASATVLCGTVNSQALTRHGDCSGNCQGRHFECGAAWFCLGDDWHVSTPL